MKLDIDAVSQVLAAEPGVLLAALFGSSREGNVREGSDVDIGVLLSPAPSPMEFYEFYQRVAARLSHVAELDLVDLLRADSVLAFEALCGRRLVVRNPEAVATFVSEVARQYEDDMLHAAASA